MEIMKLSLTVSPQDRKLKSNLDWNQEAAGEMLRINEKLWKVSNMERSKPLKMQ